MRLQAYVFCGFYEHGRVKRLPPDPEIVDVSTNGDVGCHYPTPAQNQAFLMWRYHAGVVIESRVSCHLNRRLQCQQPQP